MSVLWLRSLAEQMFQGRRSRGSLRRTRRGQRSRLNCMPLEPRVSLSGSGAIEGSLWYDTDGDGLWGAAERPLADTVVYLDQNGNGRRDNDESSVRTDVSGAYVFSGLDAGTYSVRPELPDGWSQTHPITNAPSNLLVAYGLQVLEHTRTGEFVRAIPIPEPPGAVPGYGTVRDLITDVAGRIHVFQLGLVAGEAKAFISTYTPSRGTWEHHSRPGLNPACGQLSVLGNNIYTCNTRFNLNDWTSQVYPTGPAMADLNMGLDGLLYGWTGWSPANHVYVIDPDDYSQIHDFTTGSPHGQPMWILGETANADGDIFLYEHNGWVYRYDSNAQLKNWQVGSDSAIDIDVSSDGLVVIGHAGGDLELFDEDLNIVGTFSVRTATNGNYFAWVTFATYPGRSSNTIPLAEGQLVQPLDFGVRKESPSLTLALSANQVAENSANGTVVGTFNADGDFQPPMNFSLVDSAQGRFAVVDNKLQVADGVRLNYEAQSSYYVTVRAVDYFGVSLDKAFRVDILDVNEPPTARPGGPYAVRAGTNITLDGDGGDPDQSGTTLNYEWDLDDDGVFGEVGTAARRGDENVADPVFRAVGLVGPTTYPISLRVTDNGGLTNTATVNVRLDENKPPTAAAGGPYRVREDRSTTLDGSGSSDPEQPAATLIYEWDLDNDGVFGEAGAAAVRGDEVGIHPVFSPAGLAGPRTVSVSLRVTDDGGSTNVASADVQIVKNELPTAVAGGPYRVLEGRTKSLDGSGSSDPEQASATLIYDWDFDGDGIFGEVGAAALRGDETGIQAVFSAAGLIAPMTLPISLRVTDDGALTDVDTATILIAQNEPPTVVSGGPYSVVQGQTATLDASRSSDLDQASDALTYDWDLDGDGVFGEVGGAAIRGDEVGIRPVFSAAALIGRITVPIALRVTDDGGLAATATTSIQVLRPTDPRVTDGELIIAGTNAADVVTINTTTSGLELEVKVNRDAFQFSLDDITSYVIDAGLGNDSVSVAESVQFRGRIIGGVGNDTLTGGGGDEEILGGDGNDRLIGGGGKDTVDGEAGNDILLASRGRDILRPGSGKNSVQLGSLATSLQTLTIDASMAQTGTRRGGGRGSSGTMMSGQITVSLDSALSGPLSASFSVTDSGTIDGHPCTGILSASGSGTVSRLKYRTTIDGNIRISCSGLGTIEGSVSGSMSGSLSLQRGVIGTSGAAEIFFNGRRSSRSSIGGTATISEVTTEIS